MQQHHRTQPRRHGGRGTRFGLALAVAALAGCGEHSMTEPEDLPGDQLGAVAPVQNPAADLATVTGAATRLPKSFFVNPVTGSDANAGTQLKPFKTLAKGLSLSIAGDTLRLAAGTYSAASNGEKFTTDTRQVVVPAGVKIFGTFQGESVTFLHGGAGDLVGLNFQGGATVRNLFVTGFPTGVKASQGVQAFKNVVLDQNDFGLELGGSAKATLTGSTVFVRPGVGDVGAGLNQQAQLTLVGGRISTGNPSCNGSPTGVALHDAARLTMKNGASLQNFSGRALIMSGTSKAMLTDLAKVERDFSSLGCSSVASVFTTDSTTLTVKNAKITSIGGISSVGIQSESRGLLTLDSAQVVGHTGAGVQASPFLRLVAKSGTLIKGNKIGIDANSPLVNLTISGTTITENTIGLHASAFTLRNSHVYLNQTGILVIRSAGLATIADLGEPLDPGNNKLEGNSGTGVAFEVLGLGIDDGSISASGNTWNTSTQGTDASGHYGSLLVSGISSNPPASGKNFILPNSSGFEIQL